MKHTGKTHHGASLAASLGREFVDIDSLIQELDAASGGMRRPVREIFREDGVERFQQLETAACRMAQNRERPVVVATGGGVCDNHDAMRLLQSGTRVYLHDSLERLTGRVFASGIPAFLGSNDPEEARQRFAELYVRRSECYKKTATITVSVEDLGLRDAERKVIATVKEYLGAG
jgi:shikimate kinase